MYHMMRKPLPGGCNVEVVNWTYDKTAPDILATSRGEDNVVNDRPMPDGETRKVNEKDRISGSEDGDIEFFNACRESRRSFVIGRQLWNEKPGFSGDAVR